MNKPTTFWMVAGTGTSHHRHETRFSAEVEAKRLAAMNPGQWFFVVEAVSAHIKNDVISVSLRGKDDGDDGIPF